LTTGLGLGWTGLPSDVQGLLSEKDLSPLNAIPVPLA